MFQQQSPLKKLFNVQSCRYKPQVVSQGLGNLYQKGTKNQIPLKSIFYEIEIIDSLAFVCLAQNYINSSSLTIETEFFFSISDNACFYEFIAIIDQQTMIGQVKEKQEAKAEYEQNKAKGNMVAYSEINKEVQDVIKVNIGNVPPNTPITIKFGYLQELDICLNKFWKLLIPATLSPRYTPETQFANLLDMEIEDLQNINLPQISQGYEWTIKIILSSMTEVSFIRSPSHEISAFSLDNINCKYQIQFKNQNEIPNKDFTLLFGNKSLGKTNISLAQNNEEETPYCAMISCMPEFNNSSNEDAYEAFLKNRVKNNYEVNLMSAKGEYIFLLDRSGSMSGNRIKMATTALKFFIKSLPPDSYFNIIGFGSTYEKLYEKSSKTNENLITSCLVNISKTEANLGGTEIYNPLKVALDSTKIDHYPKNIFILTDGDVSNVVSVLSLIAEFNDLCRIYTIGVGNGCSREIIVEGAKLGKGKHEFIAENEDMNEKIINLLEDSITPFLSNFQMVYDKTLIEIVAPLPESINFIRKNEDLKIFAFMNKKFAQQKQTKIQLEYFESISGQTHTQNIDICLNDLVIQKDYLHKYGAFQVIKRIQRNLNYEKNFQSDIYLAKKDNLESYCLNFALKYQILTPFTSFICVMKQNPNQVDPFFQSNKVIIPTIESVDYQVEKVNLNQNNFFGAMSGMPLSMSSQSQNNRDLFDNFSYNAAPQQQSFNFLAASPQKKKYDMRSLASESLAPQLNSWEDTCQGGLFSSTKTSSTSQGLFCNQSKPIPNNTNTNCSFDKFVGGGAGMGQPQLQPSQVLPPSQDLLQSLLENQKLEGYWENNEENARYMGKNLQNILTSLSELTSQFGQNLPPSIWMTALVLYFLETLQKEKIGTWRLIWRKGEQWMKSQGFDYLSFKEKAKRFIFGVCRKQANVIPLLKNCNCGKTLVFMKSIPAYQGGMFCCDLCTAANKIEGGVFHCDSCQYDLCEECNNEMKIKCNTCGVGVLKWMNKIPQPEYKTYYWCDICMKKNEIDKGVYHCSGCGKFDLCLSCKAER